MDELKVVDPTILKKGDKVHYYGHATVDNKLIAVIEVGTVEEDNLYIEGVDVVGDGWCQYVGKWFICKVERNGEAIFIQDSEPGK